MWKLTCFLVNGAQALSDEPFTPSSPPTGSADIEKIQFPSPNGPLPTFTAYDRRGPSMVESLESGRTFGPRFSNKDAQPFESGGIAYPDPALRRLSDNSSIFDGEKYDRPPIPIGMTMPAGYHSRTNSGNSSHSGHTKERWIIE